MKVKIKTNVVTKGQSADPLLNNWVAGLKYEREKNLAV